MAFRVYLPGEDRRAIIAAAEGRCYWSAGTHLWLRKWGLLCSHGQTPFKSYAIVAREALSALPDSGFLEGPLSADVLDAYAVEAVERISSSIEARLIGEPFVVGPGLWPGPWGRPVDLVRRIPAVRGEISEPYELTPGLAAETSQLRYQRLLPPSGWTVLAVAREEGEDSWYPVVIGNGQTILSGLPLLDMAVEKMSMPDCPDGYYAPARMGLSWQIESWLAELLVAHAIASGAVVMRLHPWPNGKRAAFTVRHDYDREVSDQAFDGLMDFYRESGVRASVGFMTRLLPQRQIARLRADGHEVVLHSEAPNEAVFRSEVQALSGRADIRVHGATCHGGLGAAGHLGKTLFQWCVRAGLTYAEQLGRDHLLPHPAVSGERGEVERMACMVMSGHRSLDVGTAPHANLLPAITADVPLRLASGGVVNIMNHPDIHVPQLKALIAGLDLRDVWCATHREIVEWCRITKFDSQWALGVDEVELSFGSPLPNDLTVEIATDKGVVLHVVPAEHSHAVLPIHAAPHSEVAPMPTVIHSLGRCLERASSRFRRKSAATGNQVAIGSAADAVQMESGAVRKVEQPLRAALIVRSFREAQQALDRLKDLKGIFRFFPQEVRFFSLSGGGVGLPTNHSAAASFFHTDATGLFDLVYVDPTVRLFDTAYGAAFVDRAMRMVAEGGRLLLPNWDGQHPKSGIRSVRLAELFGTEPSFIGNREWMVFDASSRFAERPSVLSWYLRQGSQLIVEELSFRNGNALLPDLFQDPLVAEFLLAGELVCTDVRGARSGLGGEDVKAVIEEVIGSHAYLISGLSYKAAIIKYIVDEMMPGREKLVYGDVGGGFGALAAELLVSSDYDLFSRAVTRDIASQNIFLARSMYGGIYQKLRNRFKFSLGPAETFPYEDGFDVISFIGSLLYVDKAQLHDVLDRAWRSIRPGGLFIVHENIKNPSFVRDFDVMFEASELDALLGPYGEVRCFLSSGYGELPATAVGDRTVFRVLQKTAG